MRRERFYIHGERMAALLSKVLTVDDAIREMQSDRRRSIYECYDGTFAIDYQGGVIARGTIDELELRGVIKRRWADQPELNCWILRE